MNVNLLASRGVSLENIAEEEGAHDFEVEVPMSSRISSTTDARGTPRSVRRGIRRQFSNSFNQQRLNSFEDADDLLGISGSPRAAADDWEYSRADINVPPHFTMADVDLSPRGLEKNMRDLLTDSKYWISMVERLGYDKKVFDSESIPNLDLLSRYYDSSDLGLLRVFHLFDSDKDRLMSKDEMLRGLAQQGMMTNPDSRVSKLAFDELFELVTDDDPETGERDVSPLEFLNALKALRLGAILHPFTLLTEARRNVVASREMDMHLHEYREDHLSVMRPLSDPIDFLFRVQELPLDPKTRVQWVHCHEASRRTVLALAVRLGLDSRYVLDVFTLWRELAKADRVRDIHDLLPKMHQDAESTEWVFLVIPVIRINEQSRDTLEPHFAWRRAQKLHKDKSVAPPDIHIDIETCNMAIFVSGRGGRGTVLTFTSEWCGLCRLEVSADGVVGKAARAAEDEEELEDEEKTFYYHPRNSMNTMPVADADLDMFTKVLKVLDTSYSHLRTGDAFTLVLKVISDICEDYVRIIDAYEAAIDLLNKKLNRKADELSQKDVRQIQRSARQLSQLHRLVRPVTAIIDILSMQKDWGGESTLYISDLKSNVSRFLSDSLALSETSQLLRLRFQKMGKAKAGKVLYLLTMVTAIFVPAESVATLYGMNFKNPNDVTQFAMPELSWRLGYLYFWCVVVALVSGIFTLYRKKSWI